MEHVQIEDQDIEDLLDGVLPKLKLGSLIVLVLAQFFKTPCDFQRFWLKTDSYIFVWRVHQFQREL